MGGLLRIKLTPYFCFLLVSALVSALLTTESGLPANLGATSLLGGGQDCAGAHTAFWVGADSLLDWSFGGLWSGHTRLHIGAPLIPDELVNRGEDASGIERLLLGLSGRFLKLPGHVGGFQRRPLLVQPLLHLPEDVGRGHTIELLDSGRRNGSGTIRKLHHQRALGQAERGVLDLTQECGFRGVVIGQVAGGCRRESCTGSKAPDTSARRFHEQRLWVQRLCGRV